MEATVQTLVLLPVGLGLLGFLEPCTIGGHLLFLHSQRNRSNADKVKAVMIFVLARVFVTGSFGALIAFLGQWLISLQTGVWLIFGLIYFAIGVAMVLGQAGFLKRQIEFAPTAWKQAKNPLFLGFAFGFNIPACAAPILFALLGLAATTSSVASGLLMMSLFGFALSIPLVLFAVVPRLAVLLDGLGQTISSKLWIVGSIFVLLGIWSVWFGLYVDPVDWSGQ